jgi:class 3 adenylate cyclase/tetratricopeptide (TPR) repeat protein
MDCPACGREVPSGFRFCGHCGHALGGTAPPPVATETTTAERRQLTVMFCDLAGSTRLAESLDPEELRDVVRHYQSVCVGEVTRFGGHVAQYLGDGILVYFGYPEAHEDDTRRAVLAGLHVQRAMVGLNRDLEPRGLKLGVRVGIHTGPVVTGEIGAGARREALALGPTPNIAARLQDAAEPGTVVVSAATHRLVKDHFRFEPLGSRALKGLSQPVDVYAVTGERRQRDHFLSAPARGLTSPIGRATEIDQLCAALDAARAGASQTVLVSGDAGIGKSRLVQMLHDRVGDEAWAWRVCRCSPYESNSAFSPVSEALESWLALRRDAPPDEQLKTVAAGAGRLDIADAESVALLADLLGIPGERRELRDIGPARRKARLIGVLRELMVRSARRRPVILVIEDLHWADPSTLELLDTLVAGTDAPLLTVATYRTSFVPRWSPGARVIAIAVERLSEEQTRALVREVSGGKPLPAEVVRDIVARTDGVPLFVEELTKMVLESGLLRDAGSAWELTGPLPPLAIPTTLQDSLTARLDRLSSARDLAQLCAVIGREFTLEMLQAVSERTPETLRRELDRLVDAELLHRRDSDNTYAFKHALIQDAAYSSLLKSTRHRLHQHVAQVLAGQFGAVAELRPQLLAHHYSEAGLVAEAIPLWLKAGHRALGRSENLEAIQYLSRALALVVTLPETRERDERELEILSALGAAQTSVKGYAAAEAQATYARAQELTGRLGDTPHLFWVLWGLGVYHFVRADFGVRTDRQLKRIAEATRDPELLIETGFSEGSYAFYFGFPAEARVHFERGLAHDDPSRYRDRMPPTGVDPAVTNLSFLAMALWMLGDDDAAEARAREVIARTRDLGHRFSLAFALTHVGFLNQMRRRPDAVRATVEEGLAIAEENGFPIFIPEAHFMLGWADARLADPGDDARVAGGIARMRGSLDAWRGHGARIWQTYFLAQLAEVLLTAGRFVEADAAIADGLESARSTNEGLCEPELYRLRGVLHARSPGHTGNGSGESVEADLRRALELARERRSLIYEFRAAVALAARWREQGRQAEGDALVEGVRERFVGAPAEEEWHEPLPSPRA